MHAVHGWAGCAHREPLASKLKLKDGGGQGTGEGHVRERRKRWALVQLEEPGKSVWGRSAMTCVPAANAVAPEQRHDHSKLSYTFS